MAKTRAQSSKPSTKLNSNFVTGLKTNKVKKKSLKAAKQPSKIKIPLNAPKLQSCTEKGKETDLQETEDLLKLCRTFSIFVTRIKDTSEVESESYDDIFHIIYHPFKTIKKQYRLIFSLATCVPNDASVRCKKLAIDRTVKKSTRIEEISDAKSKS